MMIALSPNLQLLPLIILVPLLLSSSSLLHIDHHHVSAFTVTTTCGHSYAHSKQSSSLSAHDYSNSQKIDWAQYSLHQSYKKAGGILYKQSLLTPAEFTAVQMAIDEMDLKLTDENESSFANNRIGAVIDRHSDVYDILSCSDGTLCRLVNGLADSDDDGSDEELGKMILSPDIPIEIRIYEKSGAGMNWHVDDIIYTDTKQIEVVFTLENTSDCCTMWKPHDQPILASNPTQDHDLALGSDASERHGENRYRVESVQTTPNSAIIIKAGSVEHKVSPLTYGRRVILKMAFVREGASMSDEMRSHVSHHNGSIAAGKSKNMNKKKAASRSRSQGDSLNARKKKRQRR